MANTPMFVQGANIINFVVNHIINSLEDKLQCNIEAYFEYAASVLEACHGDAFLFKECIKNVARVCKIGYNFFNIFLFHNGCITKEGYILWYATQFGTCMPASSRVTYFTILKS